MFRVGDIAREVNTLLLVVATTKEGDIVTVDYEEDEGDISFNTLNINVFNRFEFDDLEYMEHIKDFQDFQFILKVREVLIEREIRKYNTEYKDNTDSFDTLENNLKYYNLI